MIISAIAAVARNGVIGKDNDLVWRLPDDMKYFQETTRGHHVIMGRKNYDSLPEKWKPLPDRVNLVVSRQLGLRIPGAQVLPSIQEALDVARDSGEEEAFIIGGGQIYKESLPTLDRIYYTDIHGEFDGDTYFPSLDEREWKEVSRISHGQDEKHAYSFDFVIYERRR